jgi:DNA-binding PadR family transcriptional regulator
MPLKHAALALVVERRGYGYDLVQRFQERVGPGWQLNPSAIYPALDQLERGGLVTAAAQRGGTRRSPRVAYAATPTGAAALDAWLTTPRPDPEPLRSDLHLKLAFARGEHHRALIAELTARERSSATLLARCAPRATAPSARRLIDAAVMAHLTAELAWLRDARAALADG